MKTKRCAGPLCRLRSRPYRDFDPDVDQPDMLAAVCRRCAAVLAQGPVRVCRICKRPKPLAAKRARYARLAAIDPHDRSQAARIARDGPGPDDGPFVRAVFARMLREDTG